LKIIRKFMGTIIIASLITWINPTSALAALQPLEVTAQLLHTGSLVTLHISWDAVPASFSDPSAGGTANFMGWLVTVYASGSFQLNSACGFSIENGTPCQFGRETTSMDIDLSGLNLSPGSSAGVVVRVQAYYGPFPQASWAAEYEGDFSGVLTLPDSEPDKCTSVPIVFNILSNANGNPVIKLEKAVSSLLSARETLLSSINPDAAHPRFCLDLGIQLAFSSLNWDYGPVLENQEQAQGLRNLAIQQLIRDYNGKGVEIIFVEKTAPFVLADGTLYLESDGSIYRPPGSTKNRVVIVQPDYPGVIAHELAHALGLNPDASPPWPGVLEDFNGFPTHFGHSDAGLMCAFSSTGGSCDKSLSDAEVDQLRRNLDPESGYAYSPAIGSPWQILHQEYGATADDLFDIPSGVPSYLDLDTITMDALLEDPVIRTRITLDGSFSAPGEQAIYRLLIDSDDDPATGQMVAGTPGIDTEIKIDVSYDESTESPVGSATIIDHRNGDVETPLPATPLVQNGVVSDGSAAPQYVQIRIDLPKDLLGLTASHVPVQLISEDSTSQVQDITSLTFNQNFYDEIPMISPSKQVVSPGEILSVTINRLDPGSSFTLSLDESQNVLSGTLNSLGEFAGTFTFPVSTDGPHFLIAQDSNNHMAFNVIQVLGGTTATETADLSVTEADSPDPLVLGGELTYSVAVINNGPNDATAVTLTDDLPGSTQLISATPSQGSCGGVTRVICDIGTLPVGEAAAVTIVVSPISAGFVSNGVSIAGNEVDPNVGDNTAVAVTLVKLQTYTLTLESSGAGYGAVSGAGTYSSGQSAMVSATANYGSAFAGWTGPNAAECAGGSVFMSVDKSCTANFTLITGQPELLMSAVSTAACSVAPSGMVSWWPANGNANDIIGGNMGMLLNGATFSTGQVGQAFSFDGVDDRVSVADSASLDVTGSVTVDAWFKSDGPNGGIIVGKEDPRITPRTGFVIHVNPSSSVGSEGSVAVNCFDSSGKRIYMTSRATGDPTDYNDGQWHHVAGVCDVNNDGQATLYIDGMLKGKSQLSPIDNIGVNHSIPLIIGDRNGSALPFTGLIDEVDIFSRALTSSEIQNIYNAGSAGKCQQAVTAIVAGGDDITLSNTVLNMGSASADEFDIGFHLSTNQTYGDGDDIAFDANRPIASLLPGASSNASTSLTVPPTTPPGIYYVCAMADRYDSVPEFDETNNSLCTGTQIQVVTFTYELNLSTSGTGTGTVSGAGTYSSGETVSVSATADSNSTFTGWAGPNAAECGTGSVFMNADKACIAGFELIGGTPIPRRIYFSNHDNANPSIVALDPDTNMVAASIPVSGEPGDLIAHPDGSTLYAVVGADLAVIDVSANEIATTLTGVGDLFNILAISPNGSRLYYLYRKTSGTATLILKIFDTTDLANPVLINTVTNAVFDGCYGPLGLGVSPDGSRLYTACRPTNTSLPDRFYMIDTATYTPTQTTTFSRDGSNYTFINAFALIPDGSKVYVARTNNDGSTVEYFDGNSGAYLGSIPLPDKALPRAGVFTPDGSKLYVVDQRLGTHVINPATNTLTSTLPKTQSRGLDIALMADGSQLYTALSGYLYNLDVTTDTWIATITGGFSAAYQITATPGHP
jgi:uncharacterized repeat protein (TIGR01451 family)